MATLNTRLVLRNDTVANWTLYDPILLKGEVGVVYEDNGKVRIKIGDSVKKWSELDYFGGEAEQVSLSADGTSLVIDNGVIKLAGFETAEVGAAPVKGEDGNLVWVKSEQAIVEDLQQSVGSKEEGTGLAGDVAKLESSVGTPADIEAGTPATGVFAEVEQVNASVSNLQSIIGTPATESSEATGLIGQIEAKADASMVYTKEETAEVVAEAIANLDHLERKIVGSIDEIDATAAGADKIIYMVPAATVEGNDNYDEYMVINGQIEKVGSWEIDLSGYTTDEEYNSLKAIVDNKVDEAKARKLFDRVKYEVAHRPAKSIVNYREGEIRVLCAADTEWSTQVGGGDPNKYYMGFRAYAPDNAYSFKEDVADTISDDTMYYFEDNEFAGTDSYGRKYSVVWLPIAVLDPVSGNWTYYGASSSSEKLIGWFYSVEWYDVNGVKIDSDIIRISLTNESCHNLAKPWYALGENKSEGITGVKVAGSLMEIVGGVVDIPVASVDNFGVVKSSEEINKIKVLEDGTMEIAKIDFSRVVTPEGSQDVILGGGGAAGL